MITGELPGPPRDIEALVSALAVRHDRGRDAPRDGRSSKASDKPQFNQCGCSMVAEVALGAGSSLLSRWVGTNCCPLVSLHPAWEPVSITKLSFT